MTQSHSQSQSQPIRFTPYQHANGQMTLPGSKSISNRVLLLSALCQLNQETEIIDVLDSDDTKVMLAALRELGVAVTSQSSQHHMIKACGGRFPQQNANLFMGNAGTAIRPLTAALALQQGQFHLHGVERMHERPIGDLVEALRTLGADISYLQHAGYPPLQIAPFKSQNSKSSIQVKGNVSSQFLTALLMACPLLNQTTTIEVVGDLISKPYIEITLNLMARFGVEVQRNGWESFTIDQSAAYHSPKTIHVEGDASSASYFMALGALGGGPIRIHGVGHHSIQGDIRFAQALQMMGANLAMGENWVEVKGFEGEKLQALDLDCNHIPDAAMTLAVAALFADGTTHLRNIASWRVKETDRLAAMSCELRKVGATVIEDTDAIHITPPDAGQWRHAAIDTYDDHRMAMCFSLLAFSPEGITINDPLCVAKTFPDYFQVFSSLLR